MLVYHARVRHENRRPTLLPSAESKVEIDVRANRGLVENEGWLVSSGVLRQRDFRIVEVAAAAVHCPIDSGPLDSSFARSVKPVRKMKIAVNDNSFGVDLADVASIGMRCGISVPIMRMILSAIEHLRIASANGTRTHDFELPSSTCRCRPGDEATASYPNKMLRSDLKNKKDCRQAGYDRIN